MRIRSPGGSGQRSPCGVTTPPGGLDRTTPDSASLFSQLTGDNESCKREMSFPISPVVQNYEYVQNIVPWLNSTFSFDVPSIRQSQILLIVPRTPFVLLTVCAFNIQVYKEAAENHFSLVSSNALQSYYGVDYHFGTFKTQVLSPSLIIFQSVRAGWNNLKLEPSRLRKGIVPR